MGKIKVDKKGKLIIDKEFLFRNARVIEQTLESFGITSRVAEINTKPEKIEYCLEIAMGTPIDEVVKHHKDLGMSLATITGDVEIEAPIPGRSLIAIRVSIDKTWQVTASDHMNVIDELLKNYKKPEESTIERPEFPKTFRDYLAVIFYVIAGILDITVVYLRKLGNYIEGRDRSF